MYQGLEPADGHIGYDKTNQIIARMREGTRWRWPITFKTLEIWLRPLSIAEEMQVEARVMEAISVSKAKRVPVQDTVLRAKIVLELASTPSPNDYVPMLTDAALDGCTKAELLAIYSEYEAICQKCDPSIESLSQEQLQTMVDALKKTPETINLRSQLTDLSFFQLADLLAYITREILQKDSSPGGLSTQ